MWVGVHDHNEATGAYQHSDWETHQGEGYVGSNTWSQTYSNGGTAGVFESNGTSTWSDVRWVETTTGTSDGQVTGPVRTESGAGEGTTETPYPTFIKSYEAVTGNWTFTLPRGGYYEDWVTVTPVEGAGTSSSTSGTPEGEGGGMEPQMGDGEEGTQPTAATGAPSISVSVSGIDHRELYSRGLIQEPGLQSFVNSKAMTPPTPLVLEPRFVVTTTHPDNKFTGDVSGADKNLREILDAIISHIGGKKSSIASLTFY